MRQLCRWMCALIALGGATVAFGQARPLPGPDVQQIYERLLPQIEKISIFDHHAHPGFFDLQCHECPIRHVPIAAIPAP